jgi:hypothetical protein
MSFDTAVLTGVAAIMLAQASPAMIDQPGQSLTAQPTQAVHMGRIVGAASQCRAIDAKRIRTDIIRFDFVLLAVAKTRPAFAVASRQFSAAVTEGGALIDAGQLDCKTAASELAALEKQGSIIVKTVQTGKTKWRRK